MRKIVKGNEGVLALDDETLVECIFCNSNTAKNNLREFKVVDKTIFDEDEIYCFVYLLRGVPIYLNEDLNDEEYLIEYK